MSKHITKHKSRFFRRFVRANEAVSALEYAILVGVIAVAVGTAIFAFGGKIQTAINNLGTGVEATASAGTPQTTAAPSSF